MLRLQTISEFIKLSILHIYMYCDLHLLSIMLWCHLNWYIIKKIPDKVLLYIFVVFVINLSYCDSRQWSNSSCLHYHSVPYLLCSKYVQHHFLWHHCWSDIKTLAWMTCLSFTIYHIVILDHVQILQTFTIVLLSVTKVFWWHICWNIIKTARYITLCHWSPCLFVHTMDYCTA